MKRFLIFLLAGAFAAAATTITHVKNDQVIACEETVAPGASESAGSGLANVTVFLNDAVVVRTPDQGEPITMTVKRGDVVYRGPHDGKIRATGAQEVRFVRAEFNGPESKLTWGCDGLAPNYKVLVENGHTRVYDIRIPAGTSEPQHTHHDRIVVCLSGAQLRHVLPDGHEEDSTLKTGDCLWRRGQTHVGKNIGPTDLWVIAIEPK